MLSPVPGISADAMSLTTRKEAATLQQPHQLTLWPDDALPGQLPLFNRRTAVQPDGTFPHCNQSWEPSAVVFSEQLDVRGLVKC